MSMLCESAVTATQDKQRVVALQCVLLASFNLIAIH
jgi:hypothetical protein